MSLFLAKLTLTPLIMYLASAAGRRWGPGVSGWLTGLPLLAGAGVCLRLIAAPSTDVAATRLPRWDLPARLGIAAAFVVVQTGIAGWLGPRLSGLVTPFPIVVILLTAFAHHQLGVAGARHVLRGFLVGMYAFASFFLVVAIGLGPLGAVAAYLLGLGACLVINGMTLWALRRRL